MILLRMIPWEHQYDHLQARVMFGMNSLVLSWMEATPMPEDLVDGIVAALESDAPAPTPDLLNESPAPTAAPALTSPTQSGDVQGTVRRVIAELSAEADRELLLALKKALADVE